MALEITGKLIQKMDLQQGTSRTGNLWQKQEFVIETMEQYPKKICANLWGENVKILDSLNIGSVVTVSFSLESREFNGKWYTDVRAWRIEVPGTSPVQPAPVPQQMQQGIPPQYPSPQGQAYTDAASVHNFPENMPSFEDEGMTDDLPF
ncbi:MAG: DUF3127 domain-containing protein [Bacteroidales bacterium]|jgi:hypothetical protein|nr:DUF3127 domain-containing protein [Bacteroidales bacterium]